MTAQELRDKYLKFFESKGHKIIPSSSLVPSDEEQLEGKEKVLFTSAGMQPLIPYLMGKDHPQGKKLVDVQKCIRTDDIEEVGDTTHHTFFEMLGNWSLGDYWKEEAIEYSFEFLTKELEIPLEKLAVSVFAGDEDAPKDETSAKKWKTLGISEDRIAYLGKEANWWPTNPSATGPCGPDTEMFYWVEEYESPAKFDPKDSRWVEIWNDVFMEFIRKDDRTLEELPQKNVDTGMGFERTLAVLNGKLDDYETDLFKPLIDVTEGLIACASVYGVKGPKESFRIIADHIKAATFLIKDGIVPANKLQGYVLRRLLRRAAVKIHLLDELKKGAMNSLSDLVTPVLEIYKDTDYFEGANENSIKKIIDDEMQKFSKTLDKGLKEMERIEKVDGKIAFDLYQTYGFPLEITEELFRQKGQDIDHKQYEEEFKKHQELSRTASVGMFKGGLAGHSETEIKYHTATHLLHQALRDVLGNHVVQQGSNITPERLRFDFNFDRKLTEEEVKKVEEIINQRIKEDLKVDRKFMSVAQAKDLGAIGLFDEKYGTEVSIYMIGPDFPLDPDSKDQRSRGGYYSMEFCGGPHVEHTGVIGGIKITKEEAISAGMRRIRVKLL